MKLIEYRVREFKSIWDSGTIKVDHQTTCLVGKNEAGKTALLTALYRTNPIISTDANFDETYDYPKQEVEDYRFAVDNGQREEVVVVECQYELDSDDTKAVASVFGNDVLREKRFRRMTYYGKSNSKFNMAVDDAAGRKHLADNPALADDLKCTLNCAADWKEFNDALDKAEATEAVKLLKNIVADVLKKAYTSTSSNL